MAKDPSDTLRKLHDDVEKLSGIINKNNNTVWRSQVVYGHLFREIGQVSKILASLTKTVGFSDKAAMLVAKAYLGWNKILESNRKILGSAIGTIGHHINKLTNLSYLYDILSKALTDYNKVLYETANQGTALGRSFDTTVKGINELARATSFSKQESVEFFKTIIEGQSGFVMSNNAMINMARTLQSEFGPSLDMIKDKMADLLAVQEKDIDLFNQLDKLRSNPAGLASYLSLMKSVHGVSNKQLTTITRYVGEVEKAGKEQSKYEKGVRNLLDAQQAFTAAFSDLKVETAEKFAEAIVFISNTVANIVNYMSSWKTATMFITLGAALAYKTLSAILKTVALFQLSMEQSAAATRSVTNETTKALAAEKALASAAKETAIAKNSQIQGNALQGAPSAQIPSPASGFGKVRGVVNSIGPLMALTAAIGGVTMAFDAWDKMQATHVQKAEEDKEFARLAQSPNLQNRYISDEAMEGTGARFSKLLESGDPASASKFMEDEIRLAREFGFISAKLGDENILRAKIQIKLMDAYEKNTKKVTAEQNKWIGLTNSNIELLKKTEFRTGMITFNRRMELDSLKDIQEALELELTSAVSSVAHAAKKAELNENMAKQAEVRKQQLTEEIAMQQGLASAESQSASASLEYGKSFKMVGQEMNDAIEKSVASKKKMLNFDQNMLDANRQLLNEYPNNIELQSKIAELEGKIVESKKEIFMLETVQGPMMALEHKKDLLSTTLELNEAIIASSETLITMDSATLAAMGNKVSIAQDLADIAEKEVEIAKKNLNDNKGTNKELFMTQELEKKLAESTAARAKVVKETVDVINREYTIRLKEVEASKSLISSELQLQDIRMSTGADAQKSLITNIELLKTETALKEKQLKDLINGRDIVKLEGIEKVQILEIQSKINALVGQTFQAEMDAATKLGKRKQEIAAVETSMLEARLEFEQAAYFGIGATMQTRFDVIMAMEKEKTAIITQRIALESQLATASQEEQVRLQMEITKLKSEELKKTTSIVNMTKDLREGYLSALGAFAVGAGKFDKIIARQEFGTRNLLQAFGAPSVPQLGGIGGGLSGPLASYGVEGLRGGNVTAAAYTEYMQKNFGATYGGIWEQTGRLPGGALGMPGYLSGGALSNPLAAAAVQSIQSNKTPSSIGTGSAISTTPSGSKAVSVQSESIEKLLEKIVESVKSTFSVTGRS